MTTRILYKEFRLAAPRGIWLFFLLSAMMLIPQYPMMVGIGYVFMGVFIYLQFCKENRDLEFSAMLPVSRDSIVKSKIAFIAVLELAQILAAIPFALIADFVLSPNGNLVGMDPNFAFFGIAFLSVAAFNLAALPTFFRTGYKLGIPMVLGLLAFIVVYVALEITIQLVPALHAALDSLASATMGYRAILLAAGILVYVGSLLYVMRRCVRNFEKVSI